MRVQLVTTRSRCMRKKLVTIGLLALSSSVAMAGRVQPAPVTITVEADGSGNASGNMATARASANDVEYIGCGVRKRITATGDVAATGFCQAGDAAGVTASCFTDNIDLLDAIENVADY